MTGMTLADLQESVQDRSAFRTLDNYLTIGHAFLAFVEEVRPTRIVSPSQPNYIFYQYSEDYGHKITRPLNGDLLIESADRFKRAFERFVTFLTDLKRYHETVLDRKGSQGYVESKEINKVMYTTQQAIGSIGDSFENPNRNHSRIVNLLMVFGL
jgi:hypothetical protein